MDLEGICHKGLFRGQAPQVKKAISTGHFLSFCQNTDVQTIRFYNAQNFTHTSATKTTPHFFSLTCMEQGGKTRVQKGEVGRFK